MIVNRGRRPIPPAAVPLVGFLLQFFGFHWDISFHVELGRDSFWQPPHLMVYFGVALVFASGVVPILAGRGRASAGCYVLAASALGQIVAAPIDDLWHRLYGIDNTLWSFPHLAFIVAGSVTALGLALLAPVWRQPDGGPDRRTLAVLLDPTLACCGLFLAFLAFAFSEFRLNIPYLIFPYEPYLYPPLLIGAALVAGLIGFGATGLPFAFTITCAIFTALSLLVNLELNALDFVLTPSIPLLLPGALVADLLLARPRRAPLLVRVLLASLALGAIFYAVQFPYTLYVARPAWFTRVFTVGWPLAVAVGLLAAPLGLAIGRLLRRTRSPRTEPEARQPEARVRTPRLVRPTLSS